MSDGQGTSRIFRPALVEALSLIDPPQRTTVNGFGNRERDVETILWYARGVWSGARRYEEIGPSWMYDVPRLSDVTSSMYRYYSFDLFLCSPVISMGDGMPTVR